VIDLDATLPPPIHKEGPKGNCKGGFGYHPSERGWTLTDQAVPEQALDLAVPR